MSRPLTEADLIFPTQSLSFSTTLHSLKRSALSIHNRLSSITKDSEFVISVANAYGLPLVANERCGSWYIPPDRKGGSAYFKSTDGHTGEWSFNLRRLNLHVLDIVGKSGGCVIVDSTRRGKSMPDALSKTIPIWCCVFNRAIFPEERSHTLHTPPSAVSGSEHAQIEKRLDTFVKDFLMICKPDLVGLKQLLKKPLRPLWVTQESSLPDDVPSFSEFHPVVLCTASRRVHGGEVSEGGYVQGAADDHEAWACGLTPPLFWKNKDQLLTTNEEALPPLVTELVKQEKGSDAVPIPVRSSDKLSISSSKNVDISPFDVVISCTSQALVTTKREHLKKKYLHLACQEGKLGARDLRAQLQRLPIFFETLPPQAELGRLLVCCPTGKDLSVGVALSILCLYTDDAGIISPKKQGVKMNKTFTKQRLTWITTSDPTLNPSRETLKSVNTFLMPDPMGFAKAPIDVPSSRMIFVDENGQLVASPEEDNSAVALNGTRGLQAANAAEQESLSARIFATLLNDQRPWKFHRTLSSALSSHPSGTVTGTAMFTPFTSSTTKDNKPRCLYEETGEFTTDTGLTFTARRKYIYQLHSPLDGTDSEDKYISMHFFDDSKEDNFGGLFVEMCGLSLVNGIWVAKNREQHLCGQDLYSATWRFSPSMFEDLDKGNSETWWEIRYDVKGPKKDYVSETKYARVQVKT